MRLLKSTIIIALMMVFILYQTISCASMLSLSRNMVWAPDNRDGTYKNPIIYADYSDPDVVCVGNNFYMVSSSFNCIPGLPVLHSKDLVNWTIVGHVFQKYPFEEFNSPQHGNGVWAPSIRYHNGEYYVYFGDPDRGIFMSKTRDPAGPWEPLVHVKEAKGWIDCCPFWDDDGSVYLVHAWAKSRAGINSILTINRMSSDGTKILGEGKMVFDGHDKHPTIEGPKLYKRNGYYYIFAPAGGVHDGWQTVLRARSIYGPYKDRIVVHQGNTDINGPHQGGWVELKSGESWFIHFQDRDAYGRIIHLQPVKWVDDWPVMGIDSDGDGTGEPVLTYKKPDVGKSYPVVVPQTSDEFEKTKLGLQWQWHANYQDNWMSLAARQGYMRLFSVSIPDRAINLWSVPNLILQKLPAPEFTVTTKIEFNNLTEGDKAGLVVMGMDYSYLAVESTSSGYRLIKIVCKNAHEYGKEMEQDKTNFQGNLLLLRVKVAEGAVCHFSYSNNGNKFTAIGDSFTAREGRWIGAKVGLFCLAKVEDQKPGYADFDWFRFE